MAGIGLWPIPALLLQFAFIKPLTGLLYVNAI